MGLGDPSADGKSEARALFGMGPRLVRAEESVENSRPIFVRNPNALIGNRQTCVVTFRQERHFYFTAGMRILDGILDEIQQQFAKPEFITQHDRGGHCPEHDLDTPVLSQECGLAMDVFD